MKNIKIIFLLAYLPILMQANIWDTIKHKAQDVANTISAGAKAVGHAAFWYRIKFRYYSGC
ncbi:hypothetical protein HYV10_01720 [Candidatus Dependentiae bacterium]|nr:hypothetical protein [Candidatus Dependentiae bacterium]